MSLSLQPFFQSLAIIQTTVLSIIVAIYALSTQIAAERFTTRVISPVAANSSYRQTILIFTSSIFLDIFALLVHQISPAWLTWLLLSLAVLGVSLTFRSLFYLRDELLATTESVATAIRDGIKKDAFEMVVEEDKATNPFYSFFEAGRSAIREEDKDAANKLVVALCECTASLFEEIYNLDKCPSDEEEMGLIQILSEEKSLAIESIERRYDGITKYVLLNMNSIIEMSIKAEQDTIASDGIQMCYEISREVIKRDQLVRQAWLIWEDILVSAARNGMEEILYTGTTNVSDLVDIAIEKSNEFEDRKIVIAQILLSGFLTGWSTLVANHGKHITKEDRVDKNSEFRWYRFFEWNFEITSRNIVSHNADLQIPAARMLMLRRELIKELSEVAVSAAKIQNLFLAQRLSKMVIEVGLGFKDDHRTRRQIISGLAEIKSTNDCGESAVHNALSELQTPAEMNEDDDGIPITSPWVLNFISYTFEGQEEFILVVSQIENEMISTKDE